MTVGERIKARRKEIGVSADELAEKIGVSRSTIFRYEKGDIEKMPGEIIGKIAVALLTTPGELMGWVEDFDEELLKKQNQQWKEFAKRHNENFFQKQLLSSFNKLNDDNKKKAITYTENLLKIEEMENEHLIVKAAHNDFAEDEKEQKLMQEDIDEL